MKPFFADQYAILAAADCSQQGLNVFLQNPCDPYNRIHVYSRLWLVISQLGVHTQHNTFFGITIICSFLFAAVLSIKPTNLKELLIAVLFLSSPAVMLGVERGNSDLIMYTLCVGGVYFLTQRSFVFTCFSYLVFTLAFSLKFYPIASFVILIKHIKKIQIFYCVATFLVILISVYVAVTFNDLLIIKKNIPNPDDFFMTFGAKELIKLLDLRFNIIYVSFPLIIFTIIIGSYLSNELEIINSNIDIREILLFLAGTANLCLCFFVNINYHYRCVYLLCCLPYFFSLKEYKLNFSIKMMVYVFYFFSFSCVWAEFFIYWVGEPAIQSILKISMMDAIRNIQLLKHASSWGFSMILLIFFFAIIRSALFEKLYLPSPLYFTPKKLTGDSE